MSEDRRIYGTERFEDYLKNASGDISQIVEGLVSDVEAFVGNGPVRDDTCVVALQRNAR